MPRLRLQYDKRSVPMRDLQYAEPLDINVPEGASITVLGVTPIAQEYRIDYVVVSPAPDEET